MPALPPLKRRDTSHIGKPQAAVVRLANTRRDDFRSLGESSSNSVEVPSVSPAHAFARCTPEQRSQLSTFALTHQHPTHLESVQMLPWTTSYADLQGWKVGRQMSRLVFRSH
jgi:hypothetical protein